MSYADLAYKYAKAQGWTSTQVRNASYQQVANVCGVILGANGESPNHFHHQIISHHVATRLKAEEDATQNEIRKQLILLKIQELAGENNTIAKFIKDGETAEGPCIVIRRAE